MRDMGRWSLSLQPLAVVCVAFSLLVAMHAVATPIFEAPDEVWHYAYVRWVAEGNGLPPLDSDRSGAYQEAAQPPLYYAIAAALSAPFDDGDLDDLMWGNPSFGYQSPGTIPDNKNMLIHTPSEGFPWRGVTLAVQATRLASWLFGLCTVVAAWGLGMEAFRSRRWALVTASIVAFHPQFVFISSVVSNDSAAAAVGALTLWLAAHLANRGPTWQLSALAGVLAGTAAITKSSTLLALPLLLGAWLVGALRGAGQKGPHARRWTEAPVQLAVLGGCAAAVGGWWYVRNAIRYGVVLGLTSHTSTPWGRPSPVSLTELVPELPLVLRSYWAAYGWGHVTWPDWVYAVLWLLAAPLFIAAIVAIVSTSKRHARDPAWSRSTRASVSNWRWPTVLSVAWCGAITLALIQWMRQVEAPHGRLLLPAVAGWAVLLTLGLCRLGAQRPRWGRLARSAFLGAIAVVATLAPGARIASTFALPRLYGPELIRSRCNETVDFVYGDWARLICASTSASRVAPGETVAVTACWESLQPTSQDYTVFVHLLGPRASRPAERQTYPGLGRYPTSLWQPGTAFCDVYRMEVAEWASAPVRYLVEIGLFDSETGRRLPGTTSEGAAADPPIAAEVTVIGGASSLHDMGKASTPEAPIAGFRSTSFAASLEAVSAPSTASPGEEMAITLYWRALQTDGADYAAFVHLWEPGLEEPVAQHDGHPRQGWFPTSAWRRGDLVPDTHALIVPAALPPGSYNLWAGLYRPTSGTRLVALAGDDRFPDDIVPIGTLEVR